VNETRYPLCWPKGWPRSKSRVRAQFGINRLRAGQQFSSKERLSIDEAFRRIEIELERLGVDVHGVVVSTNLKTNLRGLPMGNSGEPSDPGVAIYWELKGKMQCMPIDRYDRVADNLAAIAATLEALRAVERHGGAQILERAFLGFAQLPGGREERPWREVLQFGLSTPTASMIEERYRSLAKSRHPDKDSGDHDAMSELNVARAAALAEVNR
jgi:hypothetical protein